MSDQDFSRFSVDRELDEMATGSARLEKKAGVIALRLVVVAILAAVVICFAGAFGAIRGVIDNTPDISKVSIEPVGYATFVYDAGGNTMQKLSTADANRIQVSLDEVPDGVKTAFIVLEDSRFYQHSGVDVRGIVRALAVGFQSGMSRTEGASTITQQLLKNNYFQNWTEEKTLIDHLRRKIQEQYMAVQLEERLERELGSRKAAKDRILESYLNTINLGAGTYGVQAAARKYFGKNVGSLSISEAAVIAGITQNPSRYNPITHPEANAERREKALRLMAEQGYITEAMRQEALADNVYERIAAAQDISGSQRGVYSYFVDELTQQVLDDLVKERGMDEAEAARLLYAGGLKIYSTEDMAIQQICDEEYADPDNFPEGTKYSLDWSMRVQTAEGTEIRYDKDMLAQHFRETEDAAFDLIFDTAEEAQDAIDRYKAHLLKETDNILAEDAYLTPEPQSSIVIIDQDTGAVRAIVGGRGEKTASLVLNRATRTLRQPGSVFKPISAYAAAMERGMVTLATVFRDEPYAYKDGTTVGSGGTYLGDVTVREAIVHSLNVPAVKCITEVKPEAAYDCLKAFGITTLTKKDKTQALALGGITKGVSNLELTAAYAALANKGVYVKPYFYTRVTDANGNVLLEKNPVPQKAVSESTAALLTSALEDVVTRGTGAAVKLLSGMPAAGKTGTSNDVKDLWFVGYTPYYTCGIWSGYDLPETMPEEGNYRKYHQVLWNRIMTRIHEDHEILSFEMPGSVRTASICAQSGKLAGALCDSKTEYFAIGTAPADMCTGGEFHETPSAAERAIEVKRASEKAAAEAALAAEKARIAEEERRKKEEEERKKKEAEEKKKKKKATPTPTPKNKKPTPTPKSNKTTNPRGHG